MSDTSVDVTTENFSSAAVIMAPSWDPEVTSTNYYRRLVSGSIQLKPSTIYNPKDKWGYRTPSPYSRKWLQMATTPYRYSTQPKPGESSWFEKTSTATGLSFLYGMNWENTLFNRLRPGGRIQVSTDNQARTNVLKKVSLKKWDFGTSVLELRETTDMVATAAKDLLRAGRALTDVFTKSGVYTGRALSPNGRRKLTSDVLNTLNGTASAQAQANAQLGKLAKSLSKREYDGLNRAADRWMEYQFGVKPTIHDIEDATAYLNTVRGSPLVAMAKAGATQEEVERGIEFPAHGTFHYNEYRRETKFSVHYSLVYTSGTDHVSDLALLGLDNGLSVGWESAKLTWLIDYFIGMGDWLETWSAAQGLTLLSGTCSTIWRSSLHYERSRMYIPTATWREYPQVRSFCEGGEMNREVLTRFPTPALAPNLKGPIGGVRLANSLFALRNFFRHV